MPSLTQSADPVYIALVRLLASLKQLVNLFLLSGYAFGGNVSIAKEGESLGSAKGTKFAIRLDAPATRKCCMMYRISACIHRLTDVFVCLTVWSGKVLQADGAKLSNSFLTKAATELINRAGYQVSSAIKYEGTSENIAITIL